MFSTSLNHPIFMISIRGHKGTVTGHIKFSGEWVFCRVCYLVCAVYTLSLRAGNDREG